MARAGAEDPRREPFASWLSGNLREGGMDPVITGQLGREHPLARYLDDFLADLTAVPVRAYLAGIAGG
jgi:hypothetical protein